MTPNILMLLLLTLTISADVSRASAATNAWSQRQPQVKAGQAAPTQINSGLPSDIEDQIMRQQEPAPRLSSPNTGPLSPIPGDGSRGSGTDSQVAMLEASMNGIQKTLDAVLDWLCQTPTENNPKTAAGSVMCQRNQKVNTGSGIVEEAVVAGSVAKVDRAPRTRAQSAVDDDGWSTVGGGSTGGNKLTTADPWLSSGKCGHKNRLPDGHSGQCNPKGEYPCCQTISGWCGNTPSHCTCAECTDYRSSGRPSGPITVADMQTFTEELLQKDTNNVASQIRINRQGQTNSRAADDKAQEPLVVIPSSALNKPTIVAFRALLDNYDPNVKVKEVESNAEKTEQTTFLNELMKTQVMQHTEQFLTSRGKIRRPLKDVLKEIWFTMYKRAGRNGNEGSSGFEHSFIGELKDGKVSGFHNWIQFGHEEQDGDLDYKGWQKYVNLGNKGQIVKIRFTWMLDSKPVGSLFVGTSPELELALYTVCFLVKPDQQCQVKLNNKKFNIQTWTQTYKGKKLIGSAYPDI